MVRRAVQCVRRLLRLGRVMAQEGGGRERKVWFIPTGTAGGKPQEPVEVSAEHHAIMPPLFR